MRETLERQQAWIYLVAILAGMAVGTVAPSLLQSGESLLWPMLGLLLYATFTQLPLTRLAATFRDGRFIAALLFGYFLCMPLILGWLRLLLPPDPAIQLGVLLVLLVPCTDWFISFTYLGRGDAPRAIAAAPLLLITQLLLLPVYLWLLIGTPAVELALSGHLLTAFAGLILLPLMLAWLTEYIAERSQHGGRFVERMGILPVPLLAMVIFLITGSQISIVLELSSLLGQLLVVFVLYLIAAVGLGKLLTHWFWLSVQPGRTLVFSFGTRNSFIVLPLALAAPDAFRAAVVVIVFQSLVELFGMVAFIHWVPRQLMPER